jgi:uncharacterized protein (DUF1330 family)
MPAYLVVNYKIENPALYGEYQAAAGPALKIGSEAQLVAFEPNSEVLEGSPGHQTIILKFESKEKALELYRSGDYQAVVGKRLDATSSHFAVVIDGIPD